MRAKTLLTCLALLGATGFFEARAEVSARLDEDGQYAGMIIRVSGRPPRIWSGAMATADRRPLNPTGDLLGDLAPTVVENQVAGRFPTAIWSHPNGPDYDLVCSRWTGAGWSPIQFVQMDNFSNDLEPRFGFNSTGRPYLVWWSDEAGVGVVYFTLYLESRWMTPVRVSILNTDARHPDLTINSDLAVLVSYDTPAGRAVRTITLPNRSTITDDIDPKIRSEIAIQ